MSFQREGQGRGPRGPSGIDLPPGVSALLLVLFAFQVLQAFGSYRLAHGLIEYLAFVPFIGGSFQPERLYGLFTHALLHGGWGHLIFNSLWLAIGGKVICRYLDTPRFFLFALLTAAGGGLAMMLAHWGETVIMVGASGIVFGILGAGTWFWVGAPSDSRRERLKKMAAYVAIMMVLNVAYAYVGAGAGLGNIAWEAHAGGFFTGLIAFPLLLRRRYH